MKNIVLFVVFVLLSFSVSAENGHHLWLRNANPKPVNVVCIKTSPTLIIAKQVPKIETYTQALEFICGSYISIRQCPGT